MKDSTKGDTRNAAVITMNEFMRIKNSIKPATDDAEAKKLERKVLHETALESVKKWPNTLDTLRKKKEDDKIKKLRDEEIKRREIDLKEAAYQDQLRKAAIEKANEELFQQQDQVKAFNSKMMLADVLEERDAQMRMNKRKKEILKGIDEEFVDMEKQQMAEYDEKERIKAEEFKQKKLYNAEVIKSQWNESQAKKQRLAQELKVEGELIKRQVMKGLEEDYQKELEKKQRQAEAQREFVEANEKFKRDKEILKQKKLEEEKKIFEYAEQKDKLTNAMKKREEERFNAKQEMRKKMIDRQFEVLSKIKNMEDQRLEKQVAEAEEKEKKKFEEKERKMKEARANIESSRLAQERKKKAELEAQQREKDYYNSMWKGRMKELVIIFINLQADEEIRDKEEYRERNKALQGCLDKQIADKKKRSEENFLADRQQAAMAQALADQEDKAYYSYAERCIKEWQAAGKNIKPLLIELKAYKNLTK